jgi:uncharacterized protein (TIGR02996 family)
MRTFTYGMGDGYQYYWTIELHGQSITVETGRIGSTRETQTQNFASATAARDEHDRLVAQMVNRVESGWFDAEGRCGYRELIIAEPEDPTCERLFTADPIWGHVNRFWILLQDGLTLTLSWGEPGRFPQDVESETLTFANEEELRQERDKRIARKFTEAYREATETRPAPLASPFSPLNPLVRRLVRDTNQVCDLYVREGALYLWQSPGRPAIRWQGRYSAERLQQLVEEKKAEGYTEVPPPAYQPAPMQAALEAAIEAEPESRVTRMAYADWLADQSEPMLRARGEFIQVQLALADASLERPERERLKRREEELLDENREAWLGLFADAGNEVAFTFDRGWVHSVTLKEGDEPEPLVRALCAWPLARLLVELELSGRGEHLPLLVGAPFAPHLRKLKCGEPDRCGGTELAPFLREAVRLECLEVYGVHFDMAEFFALPMTRLRELTIHGCEHPHPLEVLAANTSLACLESIRIWPHFVRSSDSAYITTSAACALLRSPNLPGLKRIAIYQSDLGDEGCAALVESGLLGRLEELDLDMGRISDAGALLLAACPELPRLKRLVLTQNQLTEVGIAALAATGVRLEANRQFSAEVIANQGYLEGGDFE